jgi:hypothetical protein
MIATPGKKQSINQGERHENELQGGTEQEEIMSQRRNIASRTLFWCALILGAAGSYNGVLAQSGIDTHDMERIGHSDLQGRSAYEPTVIQQGNRFILYVGHHAGSALNPLTGSVEANGTSIVDVTNPRRPVQLYHIPGVPGGGQDNSMVRVCAGSSLPHGMPGHFYMLRVYGSQAHEIWDTTNPSHPTFLTTVVSGLNATHKNWWECDTGIAYLVANKPTEGWHVNQHIKIYDLSNPASPRYIRDFGLAGQNPVSMTTPIPPGVHGPIAVPSKNRVYIPYGVGANGVVQIVDRNKLLTAFTNPVSPTDAELLAPQVGRIDMSPDQGGHTTFPVFGIPQPEYDNFTSGKTRDVLVVTSESTANFCQEAPHFGFLLDITTDSKPWPLSTLRVNDDDGNPNFCSRGPRFGTHATNENFYAPYYGRLTFISYFDAGVRVWDIRDPVHPKQVAHFIPPVNSFTQPSCATINGQTVCKTNVMTNNVELDTRNLIYIVDRVGSGADILQLIGDAAKIGSGQADRDR